MFPFKVCQGNIAINGFILCRTQWKLTHRIRALSYAKLLKRAQQHVNFLHKLMDFQTHQNLPLPPDIAIMMTALESPNLGQARQFSSMQMDLHCVMVSVQTGLVFVFLLWDAI